eukprot:TRINITY_DN8777_c0_g1_i1.p1 TRINITY_DN8777_c0_g1~~TRINITY_DN8777_c0_g1_i1.p1  ORF type:complete len:215 (+),score=73.78 TRINITY_DN8777_c0_g1_i1:24-647(+)
MQNMKSHPNVVLFIGIVPKPFCIVTEFLEGGDLRSLLANPTKGIDLALKMRIIRGCANGMMHLSKEGIIHRDLAARNILLTRELIAKVADFGLSRLSDTSSVVYSKGDIGPLKWMSPEAIRKKRYSEKSDVFSFGVLCFEIISREEPYPTLDAVQAATAVVVEGLRAHLPNDAPPQLIQVVDACYAEEPEDRPTFTELVTALNVIQF